MKSAVLFLVFNRPDTTRQAFEAIRAARPSRLYVAADGPRLERQSDAERCEEVRKIATDVDWPCEVKTLFHAKNLGCKMGVCSGINWFFENETEGIILEDDILPHPTFFEFCDALLEKHRDELRVMMIGGFNPFGAGVHSDEYFYSENPTIWGWATWKNRWDHYDVKMTSWPSSSVLEQMKSRLPSHVVDHYIHAFDMVKDNQIDTWDYQWTYTIFSRNGLVAKSQANLITNIGVEGTHSERQGKNHFVGYGTIDIHNLRHPPLVAPATQEDGRFYEQSFKVSTLERFVMPFLKHIGLYKIFRYVYLKMRS